MSDVNPLVDAASRLFAQLTADRARDFSTQWAQLREMGFPLFLVPEEKGGLGARLTEAFAIAIAAGYHAVGLPVLECMITQAAFAAALSGPDQPLAAVAFHTGCTIDGGRCSGMLRSVPWGRYSERIAFAQEGRNYLISTHDAISSQQQVNPADEPRDTFVFERAPVIVAVGPSVFSLGALMRAGQIAGALQAALEMSVRYANDRVQFGRSIGKFQTIQHNLAIFAEEAAAARAAGEAAASAAEIDGAEFEIAAAKCRGNRAAAAGHAIAHAVHGAIGFTMEYPLNHLTRRLLAWRSEFGNQRHWARWIGGQSLQMASGGFWETLTERSDKVAAQHGDR